MLRDGGRCVCRVGQEPTFARDRMHDLEETMRGFYFADVALATIVVQSYNNPRPPRSDRARGL